MPDPILAVVHVTAPPQIDPCVIEAELANAISLQRTLSMTAEVALADDPRPREPRRPRSHGFVVVLSLSTDVPTDEVVRRVEKTIRKALRRRFGPAVSAEVTTEMTRASHAAYWCTMRGTPDRRW